MKKLNSILCILLFVSAIQAQVTYTLSPTNTVNLTLPLNQSTGSKIYQVNTGSSKILLKWERVFVNLPVGWTYTSCDNSFCYGGVPVGPNTMDSVSIGGQGFVGVDVDPANISGVGIVKIYVYQDGYYSQGDTLTWNISTTAVGINEINASSSIKIFPNPVSNLLNVTFENNQEIISTYIIDALGNKIKTVKLFNTNNTIDFSDLTAGYYNLIIETSSEVLNKRLIKTN